MSYNRADDLVALKRKYQDRELAGRTILLPSFFGAVWLFTFERAPRTAYFCGCATLFGMMTSYYYGEKADRIKLPVTKSSADDDFPRPLPP